MRLAFVLQEQKWSETEFPLHFEELLENMFMYLRMISDFFNHTKHKIVSYTKWHLGN